MKRIVTVLGLLALVAGVAFAAEFYSVKRGLDGIAGQIDEAAGRYKSASSGISAADNTLAAMPTTFKSVIDAINAGVAADPTNDAWKNAKAQLILLTADFTALKAKTAAAKACFTAIEAKGPAAVKAAVEALP